MKIAIGTVQFGLDYGVSNDWGRTPADEVGRILAYANQIGIDLVDTAPAYGDSESVLGDWLGDNEAFHIVTKTPHFPGEWIGERQHDALLAAFRQSLHKLGRERVYGLLVHNSDDLLKPGGERLFAAMDSLREAGLVEHIGCSVYDAGQIDAIMARFPIDLCQLPVSVFDQRLIRSGHLSSLARSGVEIHARSVFLQGTLLMKAEALPQHLAGLREHHLAFWHYLQRQGLTPLEAAIGFVQSQPEIERVVCGVNNLSQLQQIITASGAEIDVDSLAAFAVDDPNLVNPACWGCT